MSCPCYNNNKKENNMAVDIQEATSWPVNELGEIVAQAGVGTNNVVGWLPSSMLPVDSLTNKVGIVGVASGSFNTERAQIGSQYKWDTFTITANTGGTNTVEDFPNMTGVKAIRMQPNGAAANVQANFASALDLTLVDTLYIPIIPRDIGTGRSLSFWVYLASDTGMVNRVQARISLRSLPPTKTHTISLSLKQARSVVDGSRTDGYEASAGSINWANITTIKITCEASSAAGADNYFYVGDVFTDAPRTPSFMLGFDKNLDSQWQNALPILRKYSIPATFYVEKFRIGQAGQFGLDKMQRLSAMGHKIALHSYSKYLNTSDTATFPTAQSITDEIVGFMSWAKANNLNYLDNHCCIAIASPFESPATYEAAKRALDGYVGGGIETLRMSNDAYNFSRLPQMVQGFGGYALPTFPLVATTSQVDAENVLNRCVTNQGIASFYTHEVTQVASGNGTSIAMLEAVCAKAADLRSKGLLRIITPDQL